MYIYHHSSPCLEQLIDLSWVCVMGKWSSVLFRQGCSLTTAPMPPQALFPTAATEAHQSSLMARHFNGHGILIWLSRCGAWTWSLTSISLAFSAALHIASEVLVDLCTGHLFKGSLYLVHWKAFMVASSLEQLGWIGSVLSNVSVLFLFSRHEWTSVDTSSPVRLSVYCIWWLFMLNFCVHFWIYLSKLYNQVVNDNLFLHMAPNYSLRIQQGNVLSPWNKNCYCHYG